MSWIVIAVLVAWSLSSGFFPVHFENLSTRTYWIMGIIGAVGLFLSIIFHEMAHSLVARRFGLPMRGITLFIFGGVAEMDQEPPSPKAEFFMAVVGPMSSFFLAALFYWGYAAGMQQRWPAMATGILMYLAAINGLLGLFNLVPAFPLDGGRILRSILWKAKGNLRWGTKVSSWIGSGFGILLIVLGVYSFLTGNFIGGLWWFLIGLFLRNAASMSYQQLLIRRALEGEKVQRFMSENPVTVPPSLSIEDLVEHYIYKYHYKMFPVVEGGKLVGCMTTKQVKEVPREQWGLKRVGDLLSTCSPENTISPDADAVKALSRMSRNRASRLMVTEDNRLVGVISLKDMLSFISSKVELED
jgi:Zn-dependent protease/CBS domain-containing protein